MSGVRVPPRVPGFPGAAPVRRGRTLLLRCDATVAL